VNAPLGRRWALIQTPLIRWQKSTIDGATGLVRTKELRPDVTPLRRRRPEWPDRPQSIPTRCPTCWLLRSSDFDGCDTVGVQLSDQVGSKMMRLADHNDGVSVDLGAVVDAGMMACA